VASFIRDTQQDWRQNVITLDGLSIQLAHR
jgi:hypothetical protein